MCTDGWTAGGSEPVLVDLVLTYFVGVLADLHRAATHEPRFGLPPESMIVEQRSSSDHRLFNTGRAIRRWRVTRDGVTEVPLGELQPPQRMPGMYHHEGRGDFSVSVDGESVRVGWQVGPRFGRGHDLPVVRNSGSVHFGQASPLWIS